MFLFSFTLFILLRFIFRCSVPFRSIPFRSDIENKIYYTFFFCSHFYLLWLAFSEEKSTQRYFFLLIVFIQISANRSRPRTISWIRIEIINFAVAVPAAAVSNVGTKVLLAGWLASIYLRNVFSVEWVCASVCVRECIHLLLFARSSHMMICSERYWRFVCARLYDTHIQLCILCFLFLPFCHFFGLASLTDDASFWNQLFYEHFLFLQMHFGWQFFFFTFLFHLNAFYDLSHYCLCPNLRAISLWNAMLKSSFFWLKLSFFVGN